MKESIILITRGYASETEWAKGGARRPRERGWRGRDGKEERKRRKMHRSRETISTLAPS